MDVLNPSARQYTVSGLKPESVYVFRITAQTRKGWGEAAEALVVITEKRGERPVRWQGKLCICVSVFESQEATTAEKKNTLLSPSYQPSPPSAHQPPSCPPEGGAGPPGAAVLGARQRWSVSGPLLHRAATRTSGEQLERPLSLRQARGHQLHCLGVKVFLFFFYLFCFEFFEFLYVYEEKLFR